MKVSNETDYGEDLPLHCRPMIPTVNEPDGPNGKSQMSGNKTDNFNISDIFENVLAQRKIELGLVTENKDGEEAEQNENMKVKFETLKSSSILDDYSNSDSTDYRQGSTSSQISKTEP